MLLKYFIFLIIFLNLSLFVYNIQAQPLQFVPQKIFCTPMTVIDALRGQPIPPGLVGRCFLEISKKILVFLYTVSLLFSIGFIIYGGILFSVTHDVDNGKKYIIWSVIGAVITILAFSIVKGIEFTLTRY